MIKRTLSLAVVAGLVGAGLIFGGTAVISRMSPVSAAQLPALIAEGSREASGSAYLPADSEKVDPSRDGKTAPPETGGTYSAAPGLTGTSSTAAQTQPIPSPLSQDGKTSSPEASQTYSAAPRWSGTASSAGRTQPASIPSTKPAPAVKATIAELLANPSSYLGRVVSSTGRVTSLSSDRFLINDGTGQIMVDLAGDLEKVTVTNGSMVTVVGELGQISSGRVFDINALTVTHTSGATVAGKPGGDAPSRPTPTTPPPHGHDDCAGSCTGDCADDCAGSCSDDCSDDSGDDDSNSDDSGDDDSGDDDSDDDSGDDDSGDDDSGGDGEDD
jgi:hypothetical protein